MIKSAGNIVVALVAVLAAYSAYVLVAVPLIEPEIELPTRSTVINPTSSPMREETLPLDALFEAGSWELDPRSTKVLDTAYGKLLFRDYAPTEDGRIEVNPFTVVYYASGTPGLSQNANAHNSGRAIVMRAPDGAVLTFDGPARLAQASMGKLLGGRLRGEIRVYSSESTAGAGDFLDVVTRNIQMDQQRIFTPHEVRFRFGRHWGTGRNLTIQLFADAPIQGEQQNSLGITGMKSLEIVHIEKVHLDTANASLLSSETQDAHEPAASPNQSRKPSAPLEVTCQGPFYFDFQRYVASFEDHVDVLRIRDDGPIDQLNCQVLEIHFAQPKSDQIESDSADPQSSKSDSLMSGMNVERIVAVGHPVTVRSDYDVEAQRLEYKLAPKGEFGWMWADGPGRIYQSDETGVTQFSAHWKKELIFQPYKGKHVVSLLEGASVDFAAAGEFAANEIHLYLMEVPQRISASNGKRTATNFAPHTMVADGNVRFDSPQLSGSTGTVQAWFINEPAPPEVTGEAMPPDASAGSHSPISLKQKQQPKQKFDVSGDEIRLELLRQGEETDIRNVTIAGNVQLKETQLTRSDDVPLTLGGKVLSVSRAETGDAVIHVTGEPANVMARGITMVGDHIALDQANNRMWIDTPGKMVFPPGRGALSKNLQAASDTVVEWRGRMDFDGQKATFDREVKTVGSYRLKSGDVLQLTVNSKRLDAKLTQRVDFADAGKASKDVELRSLVFYGDVFVDNQRRDMKQNLVSIDRVNSGTLTIDQRKKELTAGGPGRATTVHVGGGTLDLNSNRNGQVRHPNKRVKKGLSFGQIDFQRGIISDLEKHEVQFIGQVQAVYGPVNNWNERLDADQPGGLGERGVLLNCDRMVVAEMGYSTADERMMELQAIGNGYVQGRGFSATAQRMSYDQTKDLFVLEGDNRQDAVLRRLVQAGQREDRAEARKILFFRSTNQVHVDDARYLDLSHFGGFSNAPSTPSR